MPVLDKSQSESVASVASSVAKRVASDVISRSIQNSLESKGNQLIDAVVDYGADVFVDNAADALSAIATDPSQFANAAVGAITDTVDTLTGTLETVVDSFNPVAASQALDDLGEDIAGYAEAFAAGTNGIVTEFPDSVRAQIGNATLLQSLSKAAGEVTQAKPENVHSTKTTSILPVNNVLHNFASYTYNISLHAMSIDDYNAMIRDPNKKYKAKNVLIASAGKYSSALPRNRHFSEDFYFENLALETIIGLNANERGSNAVSVEFGIIEPYGVTLVERIMKVAADLNIDNYLEMPYMIQVDFVGYDDNGKPKNITKQTKYIPIKFAALTFKVNDKGTLYNVVAVPYNHVAYQKSKISIPVAKTVTYQDIKSFFNGSTKHHDNIIMKTDGLAHCINEHFKSLTTGDHPKRNVQDEIEFRFSDDIADANFTLSNLNANGISETESGDNAAVKASKARCNPRAYPVKTNIKQFKVEQNESIIDIINYMIRNSSFVLNQMSSARAALTATGLASNESGDGREVFKRFEGEPLKWFKITTQVELLPFDSMTNMLATKTIYMISSYLVHSQPENKVGPGVRKIYDYMYTGHNQDIIKLDLDFNTTYYAGVAFDKDTKAKSANDNKHEEQNPTKEKPAADTTVCPNKIQPNQKQARAITNPLLTHGYSSMTQYQIEAADVADNLLNKMTGDMIAIDFTIIGDPTFIKQDDLFYSILDLRNSIDNGGHTPTGSIIQDDGEVYIQLNFVAPDDIDQKSGLMKFNTKKMSEFSGIYRIISVSNKFHQGQFTQELHVVRVFNQNHCMRRVDYGPTVGPSLPGYSKLEDKAAALEQANSAAESTIDDPGMAAFGGAGPHIAETGLTAEDMYGNDGEFDGITSGNQLIPITPPAMAGVDAQTFAYVPGGNTPGLDVTTTLAPDAGPYFGAKFNEDKDVISRSIPMSGLNKHINNTVDQLIEGDNPAVTALRYDVDPNIDLGEDIF